MNSDFPLGPSLWPSPECRDNQNPRPDNESCDASEKQRRTRWHQRTPGAGPRATTRNLNELSQA